MSLTRRQPRLNRRRSRRLRDEILLAEFRIFGKTQIKDPGSEAKPDEPRRELPDVAIAPDPVVAWKNACPRLREEMVLIAAAQMAPPGSTISAIALAGKLHAQLSTVSGYVDRLRGKGRWHWLRPWEAMEGKA